jgi:hypothetical protein
MPDLIDAEQIPEPPEPIPLPDAPEKSPSALAQRADSVANKLAGIEEVEVMRSLVMLAEMIAPTEFVPQKLRGSGPKVLAAIMRGRELGIGPMTSLEYIGIIEGKPAIAAELQLALVRRGGHSVTGSADAEKAVVVGARGDNADTLTIEWTIDMAKTAGLLSKDNWKHYPQAMLWWRAVSDLVGRLFSDVMMGNGILGDPVELDQ